MKIISLIAVLACLCLSGWSQQVVEWREAVKPNQTLSLELPFADSISIQKWDKKEVYIKARVNINEGEDNDNFTFHTKNKGNGVHIASEIKNLDSLGKSRKVKDLENGEIFETNCHVKLDLYFEVYVPDNAAFSLETISGNISCRGLTGKQHLQSISGDIDYYLFPSQGTDMELSTITGEMYSNFDFNPDKDGFFRYGMHSFSHQLNGGGSKLELETISGDIYLRKAAP